MAYIWGAYGGEGRYAAANASEYGARARGYALSISLSSLKRFPEVTAGPHLWPLRAATGGWACGGAAGCRSAGGIQWAASRQWHPPADGLSGCPSGATRVKTETATCGETAKLIRPTNMEEGRSYFLEKKNLFQVTNREKNK